MNSVTAGAVIAVVVVGWPLYELVCAGDLDTTSALLRGGVVAGACAVGVAGIVKLARGYEAQAEYEQRKRLNRVFDEMQEAVASGSLTDDPQVPQHETPS